MILKYLKKSVLYTLISLALVLLFSSLHADSKPNVIIVLTDDQGYGDVSLHGNPVIKTPHMDSIATEGVHFDQFHVTPMCSPTRAALLTGKHPYENGVISTCAGLQTLRDGYYTIPEVLKESGYATGIFGKWHLGRNYPNRPEDRGFQETFTQYGFGPTGISSRWNNLYNDMWVVHNGKDVQTDGFCTDALFNQAMGWMKEKSDAGEPFFTFISTNAPHFPFWAPEEWAKEFAHTKNPEFFAMMKNLDDNMGLLDEFLEEQGIKNDTLLIFTTDNGPVGGHSTYNAGMTGTKASPWEAGHRVPLFIRYPDGGVTGGRLIEGLADVTDIFPTILDFSNVSTPEDAKLSGISMKSAMLGKESLPDRILISHIYQINLDPKYAAAMYGPWRLLWSDTLYNIKEDLKQTTDVSDENSEIFTKLWKTLSKNFINIVIMF